MTIITTRRIVVRLIPNEIREAIILWLSHKPELGIEHSTLNGADIEADDVDMELKGVVVTVTKTLQ